MISTHQEQFEKTVNVFIDSINNYFQTLTSLDVDTKPPFVKTPELLLLKECTGMIGVSGIKRGFIYISGDMEMYADLIRRYVGLKAPDEKDILDMAGELSNVVSGNVRETYGDDFMISVPIVFKGTPDNLYFPDDVPIYVIPVEWNGYEAYMVVGLK